MIKDIKIMGTVLSVVFIILLYFVGQTIELSCKNGELRGRLAEIEEVKTLDGYITVKQAVQQFQIKDSKIYTMIKNKSILAYKIDNKYILRVEDLKLRFKQKKPLD